MRNYGYNDWVPLFANTYSLCRILLYFQHLIYCLCSPPLTNYHHIFFIIVFFNQIIISVTFLSISDLGSPFCHYLLVHHRMPVLTISSSLSSLRSLTIYAVWFQFCLSSYLYLFEVLSNRTVPAA